MTLLLGRTQGNVITLDDDAAGWGWFADPTPALNEEYRTMPDGSLLANAGKRCQRTHGYVDRDQP